MSTVLYPSPVFGPVRSRRLGVSLGINLMPADGKVCSFDCVYCECGLNAERRTRSKLPSREAVRVALERCLQKMLAEGDAPDVLTFAGNGEPTGHPDFLAIVKDTVGLRDRYFPDAKVAVLTNATHIDRDDVREALMLVDDNIVKLDTVSEAYVRRVNRPNVTYSVERQVALMARFGGHAMVQTMFMHGTVDGVDVSNVGDEYVVPWLEALRTIKPERVMIYTIARETPLQTLRKATPEELDGIVERIRALGIEAEASY
jgi:wyosine [tRNA(Phe)-imidazoG37] synthetase (radical SAM superfamily)